MRTELEQNFQQWRSVGFCGPGADCQWGPPSFADDLFLQGRILGFWALRPAEMLGPFPLAGPMRCLVTPCAGVGAKSVGKRTVSIAAYVLCMNMCFIGG